MSKENKQQKSLSEEPKPKSGSLENSGKQEEIKNYQGNPENPKSAAYQRKHPYSK